MDNFIIQGFTTDITTNSSSEIFTGIHHNLDAVKEIVEEFFGWYNEVDEDELEWGKWDNSTMDECLTIELFSEKHLNELVWYRANTPNYPDTFERIQEMRDGKIVYDSIRKENADQLLDEYRIKQDIAKNKWKDIARPELEGSIVITSISDNTIPYDIIEKIETTFNCERTHLG